MLIVSIHYLIKRKITNFIVIDNYFDNLVILAISANLLSISHFLISIYKHFAKKILTLTA